MKMLFDITEKVLKVLKAVKEPRIAVDRVEKNPAHLSPIFRGRHRIFYETCTGCDACRKICPVDAIIMKPIPLKRPNKLPEVNLGICIFCGLCEDVCPTKPKSIVLAGGDYDMLTGGTHKDIDQFWVRVEVPEEWLEQKKREEEEKARKRREMMAKRRANQNKPKPTPKSSPSPVSAQSSSPTKSTTSLEKKEFSQKPASTGKGDIKNNQSNGSLQNQNIQSSNQPANSKGEQETDKRNRQ